MTVVKDTPFKLASIVGVGIFLSTLDSGIINIAIPSLLKAFGTPISTAIWTVTLYTLVLSASILLFGRLADRLGRLKIYVIGLLLFATSSLLCGAATSISLLIAFRALQGLSAAMMQATSMALITTRLDGADKAKAMGIFGVFIGLGPMMGPVVGGFILSLLNWRWIFWLNIPICLLGLYGCSKLTKVKEELHKIPMHYFNLVLLVLSLFSLLLTMNYLSNRNTNATIVLSIAVGLLACYLFAELKAKHPVIDLSLFKKLNFTAPMIGIIAFGGATAVAFMLPPLYFEQLRGFAAWQVGLISLSAPLGIIFSARLSAKLVAITGTLPLMLTGIGLMSLALLALTQIQLTWPVYWIFILLLCYGLGGGLFQTPCYLNITAQFAANRQAFISALIRMIQNLAIAFESAGAAMLISFQSHGHKASLDLLTGIQHAWWLAVTIAFIAALILTRNFLSGRNSHANA